MKIINKDKIEIKTAQSEWVYYFCFNVIYDDGHTSKIFYGISGEDMLEFLNWSQENDKDLPSIDKLNQWRDFVIKKYENDNNPCKEDYCFIAYKNKENILEFLKNNNKHLFI